MPGTSFHRALGGTDCAETCAVARIAEYIHAGQHPVSPVAVSPPTAVPANRFPGSHPGRATFTLPCTVTGISERSLTPRACRAISAGPKIVALHTRGLRLTPLAAMKYSLHPVPRCLAGRQCRAAVSATAEPAGPRCRHYYRLSPKRMGRMPTFPRRSVSDESTGDLKPGASMSLAHLRSPAALLLPKDSIYLSTSNQGSL